MWNDFLGQLGKTLEETFNEDEAEIVETETVDNKGNYSAETDMPDDLEVNLEEAEEESVKEDAEKDRNDFEKLADDQPTDILGRGTEALQEEITVDSSLGDEAREGATGTEKGEIEPLNSTENMLLKFQSQLSEEMNINDTLRTENNSLKLQLSAFHARFEEQTNIHRGALLSLQEKFEAERRTTDDLRAELSASETQVVSLQDELQDLTDESERLKSTVELLEASQAASGERVAELEALSERKSSQLGAIQSKINDIKEKNDDLNRQLRVATEGKLSTIDANAHEEVKLECASLTAECQRLSTELHSTVLEYEHRLTTMEDAVSEANHRAKEAEMCLDERKHNAVFSIQNIREDLTGMQTLLKQTTSIKNALEAQCEELREENAKLKNESMESKWRSMLNTKVSDIKRLSSENEALVTQIHELKRSEELHKEKITEQQRMIEKIKHREWFQPAESSISVTTDNNSPALAEKKFSSQPLYPILPQPGNKKGSSRLESEVVRQAVEIKDLRTELKDTKDKFNALMEKHDILLLMYGEAEEKKLNSNRPSDE